MVVPLFYSLPKRTPVIWIRTHPKDLILPRSSTKTLSPNKTTLTGPESWTCSISWGHSEPLTVGLACVLDHSPLPSFSLTQDSALFGSVSLSSGHADLISALWCSKQLGLTAPLPSLPWPPHPWGAQRPCPKWWTQAVQGSGCLRSTLAGPVSQAMHPVPTRVVPEGG